MAMINMEFDEIDLFRKVVDEDQRDLDIEIDNMKGLVDELATVWSGQDSDNFCKHFYFYLEKMKTLPICMRNMSSVTKHVCGNFKNNDTAFARKLSTEKRYDDDYKKAGFKSDGFDINGKKKKDEKGVSA